MSRFPTRSCQIFQNLVIAIEAIERLPYLEQTYNAAVWCFTLQNTLGPNTTTSMILCPTGPWKYDMDAHRIRTDNLGTCYSVMVVTYSR